MNSDDWKEKLRFAYSTNPEYNPSEKEEKEEKLVETQKQDLRVRLERKNRGGKVVSIISGFVGPDSSLKELGRILKSKCGVGGSVKDGEIIVQGDFRDKLITILAQLGYTRVKKSGG